MKMVVVNEEDEVLGYKDKTERGKDEIIRVTGVWVVNDRGEVLITQRLPDKEHDPGKWEPSAAGTVEEGETYAQNAAKEIKEEIGITVEESELIEGKRYFNETSHRYFCRVFFVRHNAEIADLTLAPEELQAAQWISVPKLVAWHRERPQDFVKSLGQYLPELEEFVANGQHVELILPSLQYKDSFIAAVKEFQADSDNSHRSQDIRKLSITELEADFGSFVAKILSQARGENLPEGYVPQTTFWLVDGDEYIGRVSIRQRLTERLEKYHGHIGYDIRPSRRKRGYGTKILELVLPKAKELGLTRVLITCMTTNDGSRKIIEKNGGVLENQVHDPEYDADLLRFWIDTP